MVTIENVTKQYTGVDGRIIPVFDNFSLKIGRGEIVAIVGPNGCGKSTLLKMLGGFEKPNQGIISYAGGVQARRGIVPQQIRESLFPWFTVEAHVMQAGMSGGPDKERGSANAQVILEGLGLATLSNKYPYELSGGQAQLLALGRAFAYDPELFLFDEPFAALDYHTSLAAQDKFLRLWERKPRTTIIVTHTLDEAVLLADRVIVLSQTTPKIVADMQVRLPRPRITEQLVTADFQAVKAEVFKHLKGFLVCDAF